MGLGVNKHSCYQFLLFLLFHHEPLGHGVNTQSHTHTLSVIIVTNLSLVFLLFYQDSSQDIHFPVKLFSWPTIALPPKLSSNIEILLNSSLTIITNYLFKMAITSVETLRPLLSCLLQFEPNYHHY